MFFPLRKLALLRILLLTSITLFVYRPFLLGVDIGATDAFMYHAQIADVLQQYHHHVFPVYIGQSLFNFAGTPIARAPYLFFFVGLINFVTFGLLTSLQIQHATILISALAGVFCMYLTLRKIAPKLTWFAFGFAIFYITCPGVIGLIARLDMYFSFMVVPFLPLFFYALIRNYQKNDLVSYFLLAISLALILMAHPHIAFWCTTVGAIFVTLQLFFQPSRIIGLFLSAILLTLLSLWQLVTVYSLQMNPSMNMDIGIVSETHATGLIDFYKTNLLGFFMPIANLQNGIVTFLQLGYSLWLILLIGLLVALTKRQRLLILLGLCAFFLLMLILPFPFLTHYFWAHAPLCVIGCSNWVVERIYLILASLSCFIGILALQKIYPDKNTFIKVIFFLCLIPAISWSIWQSNPFTDYLFRASSKTSTWTLPENARHHLEYFTNYNAEVLMKNPLVEGIYDPALHNRLIDADGKPIENYDNNKMLAKACLSHSALAERSIISAVKLPFPIKINLQKTGLLRPLMNLKISPGMKYMLCIDAIAANGIAAFSVTGANHETVSVLNGTPLLEQVMMIPIFTTEHQEKNINVSLAQSPALSAKNSFIQLRSFNVLTYDIADLPLFLHSLIPYHVSVNNPKQFAYLETVREFVNGYIATVNGKKRQVHMSPSGRAMVALFPGNNDVKLFYKGTNLMRITFYISLFSWVIVAVYFWYRMWSKMFRTVFNNEPH